MIVGTLRQRFTHWTILFQNNFRVFTVGNKEKFLHLYELSGVQDLCFRHQWYVLRERGNAFKQAHSRTLRRIILRRVSHAQHQVNLFFRTCALLFL